MENWKLSQAANDEDADADADETGKERPRRVAKASLATKEADQMKVRCQR